MIITLDDFGLSKKANKEIYNWTQTKNVDYISLLPNFHFTKEAIKIYKQSKKTKYSLGLHFNLIEGKPLCNKKEIPSLVDSNGNFFTLPYFIIRLFVGLIQKEEIMKELQKQYEVFTENNIKCVHINSHQNIHVFHFIYSCIEEFTKKNDIKHIRQVSTIRNRLKKFPVKYFIFIFLYFISSLLFPKYQFKSTPFYEVTFHPGTVYD